eukprot:GHVH01000393.1.p1 GENE.GHVH01000393.1~~GHVH01000393.1.p1  ORF type:complete len:1667 (+),score=283.23 GHVH01000393.1:192-5192(+)
MGDGFDKLKKQRAGQSALDLLSDDEMLFDDLDEQQHDDLRRERMRNDFVVDDVEGLYTEKDGGDHCSDQGSSQDLQDYSYSDDDNDGQEVSGKKRKKNAVSKNSKRAKTAAFGGGPEEDDQPKKTQDPNQKSLKEVFQTAVVRKKVTANPLDALLDPVVTEVFATTMPSDKSTSKLLQDNSTSKVLQNEPQPFAPPNSLSTTALPMRPRGRGRPPLRTSQLRQQPLRTPPVPPATAVPSVVPPATAIPSVVPPATAIPGAVPPATAIPSVVPPATAIPSAVPPATAIPGAVPPAQPTHDPLPCEETFHKRTSVPIEDEVESISRESMAARRERLLSAREAKQKEVTMSPHEVDEVPVVGLHSGECPMEAQDTTDPSLVLINQQLLFYWIDLHESQSGELTLFGKCHRKRDFNLSTSGSSADFVSLSIRIPEVYMPIYLCPTSTGEDADDVERRVAEEVLGLLHKGNKRIPFLLTTVKRMSVFPNLNKLGVLLPRGSHQNVIKLLISSRYVKQLPQQLQAGGHGQTFTHAIGMGLSVTENFMLKRRLLGPCWLVLDETRRTEGGELVKTWTALPTKSSTTCEFNLKLNGIDAVKALRVWGDRLPRAALQDDPQGMERLAKSEMAILNRFSSIASPSAIAAQKMTSNSVRPAYQDGSCPPCAPAMRVTALKLFTMTHQGSKKREVFGFCLLTSDLTDFTEVEVAKRTQWINNAIRFEDLGRIDRSDKIVLAVRKVKATASWHPALEQHAADTKNAGHGGPARIWVMGSEKQLLTCLMKSVNQLDPDVLCGHTLVGGDIDVLHGRLAHHKMSFGLMSRLKAALSPSDVSASTYLQRVSKSLVAGRLVVDVSQTSREIMGSQVSYTPTSLCSVLNLPTWLYSTDEVESGYSLVISQAMGLIMKLCPPVASIGEGVEAASRLESAFNLTTPTPDNSPGDWVLVMDSMLLECQASIHILASLSALSVTRELSVLAGFPWQGSCFNLRADRNAMMLNHAFHKYKTLLPDGFAAAAKMKQSGADSSYSGGLVLEPRSGLYDNFILLMDFASLYPSIIREYNLCWTTVDCQALSEATKDDQEGGSSTAEDILSCPVAGVLPEILSLLINRRSVVKKDLVSANIRLAKITNEKSGEYRRLMSQVKSLETLSQALKLSANSMYGCLGYSQSRYYAKPLASMITAAGRSILARTKDIVESSMRLNVIYGDTDSIMVDTGLSDQQGSNSEVYNEVRRFADQIIGLVNKNYKNVVLEWEDVYYRLLLHRKKKYAFIKILDWDSKHFGKIQMKGLDLVRRDWSVISKICGKEVLELLFKSSSESAVSLVYDLVEKVDRGLKLCQRPNLSASFYDQKLNSSSTNENQFEFKVHHFVITKCLTKSPSMYGGTSLQPHVIVANALINSGVSVPAGTEVPYIICTETLEDAIIRSDIGDSAPLSASPQLEQDEGGNNDTTFLGSTDRSKTSNPLTRACHPTSVIKYKMLPDFEWYRNSQIYPPMDRLLGCLPAGQYDSYTLQQRLGIEKVRRQVLYTSHGDDHDDVTTTGGGGRDLVRTADMNSDKQFSTRSKLICDEVVSVICEGCGAKSSFSAVVTGSGLPMCPKCHVTVPLAHLQNIVANVRNNLSLSYYENRLHCSECGQESSSCRMGGQMCASVACSTAPCEKNVSQVVDRNFIYDVQGS